MDDVISRQAVKELAHNQVREKYCCVALKEKRDFYIKLADSIIDLLPPIQSEIVRCEECKYHYQRNCPIERYFSLDGFCSRGKRREVTT